MLFNSLHFLVFFCFTTFAYYSLSGINRRLLLLLASCYFYMAFIPAYLLILILIILIDYGAGIGIEQLRGRFRQWMLLMSLTANLGLLGFFKYYNFFTDQVRMLQTTLGWGSPIPALDDMVPGIVLPIGLSFHTFQSLSYIIEVYRGRQKAERDLGVYALYVLFYPQLVAGPIERPQNILPQLKQVHAFNWPDVRYGLLLMAGGFFKKVVIADRLALIVDPAFGQIDATNGTSLLLAAVAYSFQIYCDFSGYSDIAIGAGQVMGIRMMQNFQAPYLATSVTEFWRRWHISLSTWFRDYVYLPLGGNRGSELRTALNTILVFALSGLWHGADWKFVIWGLLHACFLVANRWWLARKAVSQTSATLSGLTHPIINQIITFTLVTLAWVFFRADNTGQAVGIIGKILSLQPGESIQIAVKSTELIFSCLLIGVLLMETHWSHFIRHTSNAQFWPTILSVIALCYLTGVFSPNQFIYFQF